MSLRGFNVTSWHPVFTVHTRHYTMARAGAKYWWHSLIHTPATRKCHPSDDCFISDIPRCLDSRLLRAHAGQHQDRPPQRELPPGRLPARHHGAPHPPHPQRLPASGENREHFIQPVIFPVFVITTSNNDHKAGLFAIARVETFLWIGQKILPRWGKEWGKFYVIIICYFLPASLHQTSELKLVFSH